MTGGVTGIGAASATLFRSMGADVAILGIDRGPLEAIAAETGAIAITGDVDSSIDVGRALGALTERDGGLDGLLPARADPMKGRIEMTPERDRFFGMMCRSAVGWDGIDSIGHSVLDRR